MRSELALLFSVALAVSGCDSDPLPTDAGRRDARAEVDAGPADAGSDGGMDAGLDAGADAGPLDAGFDAGVDAEPDANGLVVTVDSSLPDVDGAPGDGGFTPGPDGGPCTFPDGGIDLCGCPDGIACMDDTVCSTNQICTVDPGCSSDRCSLRGHRCGIDDDCPSGSTCERGGARRVCIPTGSECNDLRDCPTGYGCDSGSCVPRRVRCGRLEDCPWGYFCSLDTPGAPYCVRSPRRCATNDGCPAPLRCADVDGDSLGECVGLGSCTNDGCPDGDVCGTSPLGALICGRTGLCRESADCASTHECLDLAGDGVRECVRIGGSCAGSRDCPPGAICAVETPDAAPRCIDGPLG